MHNNLKKGSEERYIIYLRLRKRIRITPGTAIRLGDIAQLLTEPELEGKLSGLLICKPDDYDGNLHLIDMLRVVRAIKEQFPNISIEQYGEPHTIVEIAAESRPPSRIIFALVWVLLFIGSGLAIMNFHADVSMLAVHRRIVELLTGRFVEHPLLLQIPYSIGIGAGMVIFFNHIFKKKFNEEPSPLEVEMYMYQENSNRYVVNEEYRKMNEDRQREQDQR